jgi:hypothetical protein
MTGVLCSLLASPCPTLGMDGVGSDPFTLQGRWGNIESVGGGDLVPPGIPGCGASPSLPPALVSTPGFDQ